jgi:solute:Na+ symporter, SSS family
VTAMIAGFMSGMAGNVSAFATVWTYDVYRPLLNRNASDHHYLNMGRWCSILGVLLSIGTAYALFFFSNILEFLQVLIFFFIVPLFGVVILGMLWKRASPAGGFWGFLTAILVSISMWVYVHTFPDGYHPLPKVSIEKGAVVSVEKGTEEGNGRITKVIVESGIVKTLNVQVPGGPGGKAHDAVEVIKMDREVSLSPTETDRGKSNPVRVLAPEVVLSGTKQTDKFGVEGVPIVLKPGVEVQASYLSQGFAPAEFNPDHIRYIARSEKAKPMAVNMYSAFWTFMVCIVTTVCVSLFTRPKPDSELKNLVMGLTPMPDEGPCPWYKHPVLWATIVFIVLVAINVIFW